MGAFEKIGFYLVFCFWILILVLIVVSPNGIMDYRQLQVKAVAMDAKILAAERENRRLEKEIWNLKQNPAYIRHLAKHEHGMAEEDELVFKMKR
ncbi:MAG: septum formation initiator family protein [Desulfobacterales bacterium]|nr:septum formation initiator family protein [Desulfobacterales bacterium]